MAELERVRVCDVTIQEHVNRIVRIEYRSRPRRGSFAAIGRSEGQSRPRWNFTVLLDDGDEVRFSFVEPDQTLDLEPSDSTFARPTV